MARKYNRTGRSTTERFVRLPHFLLHSPAWRSLSAVARSVFVELATLYNGSNNGRIALSARIAGERVRCSKNTAGRALSELHQKGFIEVCSRGKFDRKTPHATEYRLTLHPCDRTNERASKRFMSWSPDRPHSVAGPTRRTAGVISGTVQGYAQESCRELSLLRDRDGHSGPSSGLATDTHIIYQGGAHEETAEGH